MSVIWEEERGERKGGGSLLNESFGERCPSRCHQPRFLFIPWRFIECHFALSTFVSVLWRFARRSPQISVVGFDVSLFGGGEGDHAGVGEVLS